MLGQPSKELITDITKTKTPNFGVFYYTVKRTLLLSYITTD